MTISAFEAAKHICQRSEWSVSNLVLQKIIYLSHMAYAGIQKDVLVRDSFEAWDYGPVVPSLYHHIKAFGSGPVQNVFRSYEDISNEVICKHLDDCFDQLSKLTPGKLVAITHAKNGAWDQTYNPNARGLEIPQTLIAKEGERLVN